jgi:hypothetical protein
MFQAEAEDHCGQSVSEYQQAEAYRAPRKAGQHTFRLPASAQIPAPRRSEFRITLSCDPRRRKRR